MAGKIETVFLKMVKPERKAAVLTMMDTEQSLAQAVVDTINSGMETTEGHYGDYMVILSKLTPSERWYWMSLFERCGASSKALMAAHQNV